MRVLVCGGRKFDDVKAVWTALDQLRLKHGPICVIEGGASGADRIARSWAKDRKYGWVTVKAEWGKYGRRAGPIRNQKMLDEQHPDMVLAFPGGPGTADMVRRARAAGLLVQRIPVA